MKKALVCGAGGFIGGHLVKRLNKEGYWVRGVDIKNHEYMTLSADEFIKGDFGCSKLTASWERFLTFDTMGKYDCGKIRKKALKAWGYSA